MRSAHLVGSGHLNNSIFDSGKDGNPDNWYYPFWMLRDQFAQKGVELNTSDVGVANSIDFELHLNVQKALKGKVPKYVMLYESPQIRSINQSKRHLAKYRLVFTWRDDLADGEKFIKINLPNKIVENSSRGWLGRDRFCCLISANKTVSQHVEIELYSERVKTIRWFEQHAPRDFDLFGVGWDAPPAMPGLTDRVIRVLRSHFPKDKGKVYFPSYRGKVASKLETMGRYRFSICYENVRDLPGYITEKIWDSFFAGCLPVYWGASNVTTYIPGDCFIDRRQFADNAALYNFLVSMTESEYIAYQERIAAFLTGDRARLFSAEAFAETIVKTIASDLATAI